MVKERVEILPSETWKYVEVFKITQWRDGCVFKTSRLGYMKANHFQAIDRENPNQYIAASVSTAITRNAGTITLDIVDYNDIA